MSGARLDPVNIPFDVWSSVFVWTLEPHRANIVLYIGLRHDLCGVCKFWSSVIHENAVFWSAIYVNRRISEETFRASLLLSKASSLDVVMRLDKGASIPSHTLWAIFTPVFRRCRTLVVNVLDTDKLDDVMLAFRRSAFDHVKRLTLCTESRGASPHFSAPLLLNGSLTRVFTLDLRGVSFNWSCRPICGSLTTLVLMDSINSPTWDDMHFIAVNAVALRFLCLRNVACREIPDGVQFLDPITFPSVTEFDCELGDYTGASATLMLRHCRMPSLSVLRFNSRGPGHTMCLTYCGELISSVKTLIHSGTPDRAFCWLLFSRLRRLEQLDIISDGSAVLDGILEADQKLLRIEAPDRVVCCPSLQTLCVSETSAADVRSFLAHRDVYAPSVTKIVLRESPGFVGTVKEDIDVLQSHAAVEFTGVYVDRPWVGHV
ncbi:hypothetical protein DFH06DRAFT_1133582 [Mycena polygramma]|nr:hypothetical protein DFH06DRAFT_1133582 [Mycena polygramma]